MVMHKFCSESKIFQTEIRIYMPCRIDVDVNVDGAKNFHVTQIGVCEMVSRTT